MATPDRSPAWHDAVIRTARRLAPGRLSESDARLVLMLAILPSSHAHVLGALAGGPATVAEIAEALGWSVHRVGRDLRELHSRMLVTRTRRRPGVRHCGARARAEPDVWELWYGSGTRPTPE